MLSEKLPQNICPSYIVNDLLSFGSIGLRSNRRTCQKVTRLLILRSPSQLTRAEIYTSGAVGVDEKRAYELDRLRNLTKDNHQRPQESKSVESTLLFYGGEFNQR